jgi:hypothetical protein
MIVPTTTGASSQNNNNNNNNNTAYAAYANANANDTNNHKDNDVSPSLRLSQNNRHTWHDTASLGIKLERICLEYISSITLVYKQ